MLLTLFTLICRVVFLLPQFYCDGIQINSANSFFIFFNQVEKLGSSNLLDNYPDAKDNKDTTELILRTAATLLADGSLDTRSEAKRIFAVLINHDKFDAALKAAVTNQTELGKISKSLSGLKQQK